MRPPSEVVQHHACKLCLGCSLFVATCANQDSAVIAINWAQEARRAQDPFTFRFTFFPRTQRPGITPRTAHFEPFPLFMIHREVVSRMAVQGSSANISVPGPRNAPERSGTPACLTSWPWAIGNEGGIEDVTFSTSPRNAHAP